MISPDIFINECKNKSYSDLLSVRDKLILDICSFEKQRDELEEEISPSQMAVYQCKLKYLSKLYDLIAEKYSQEFAYKKKENFLFIIQDYLEAKGIKLDSQIPSAFKERQSGKEFLISDHLRGLVYSLLSNQTKWHRIEPHLKDVDELFFYYELDKIKSTEPEYFYEGLFAMKCGNVSTKAQMITLNYNISILEKLEHEYGSVDAFITCEPARLIVQKLSNANSEYKLRMLGEALVWEYLRNVGIDGAKPDNHLRRFFGRERMGTSKNNYASVNDVLIQVDALSKETGLTKIEIDNVIWCFCADGYGEICTAVPHCHECVIKKYCKKCV